MSCKEVASLKEEISAGLRAMTPIQCMYELCVFNNQVKIEFLLFGDVSFTNRLKSTYKFIFWDFSENNWRDNFYCSVKINKIYPFCMVVEIISDPQIFVLPPVTVVVEWGWTFCIKKLRHRQIEIEVKLHRHGSKAKRPIFSLVYVVVLGMFK